jgi:putative multiple sugar transport system permease protein
MTALDSRPGLEPKPNRGFMPFVDSARRSLGTTGIYVALAAIIVLFYFLTDGVLLSPENLSRLIGQFGYILILAIGMVIVIIAGHIDLSVGSVVGVAGAVAGALIVRGGMPIWLGVVLTLLVGAVIGAVNGYWVAFFGIPAFIVTLAGMLVYRGVTQLVLGAQQISPFPLGFRNIANEYLEGTLGYAGDVDVITMVIAILVVIVIVLLQLGSRQGRIKYKQQVSPLPVFLIQMALIAAVILGFAYQLSRYSGIPVILIIVGVLTVIFTFVTNRTVFGRHVYTLGGNLHAAELSGVKTKAVTFWVFVIMGVLSALAGIVYAARINLANPTNGNTFELDAIAAGFIGGAAVTGGVGRVVGAIVGGTIMAVLNNGMSILGVDNAWQYVIKGGVLLAAVAFDVYSKRKVRT